MRSRLYDLELTKQREAQSAERRLMVGGGERSEKIRTYNFPTTGSPTTGSGPPSTTCRACWRASSTRSSTRSSWRTRLTASATSRSPTMAQTTGAPGRS